MQPLLSLVILLACSSIATANESLPVAVRWWGGETVSIESYWQPPVVIDPASDFPEQLGDAPQPGLILQTRGPLASEMPAGASAAHYYLYDNQGRPAPLHHFFHRPANTDRQLWKQVGDATRQELGQHAMLIRRAGPSPPTPGQSPPDTPLVIYGGSAGPRIVHFLGLDPLADDALKEPSVIGADLVLLPLTDGTMEAGGEIAQRLAQANVKFVLPLRGTPTGDDASRVRSFAELAAPHMKSRRVEGNTFALSGKGDATTETTLLVLDATPAPMGDELTALMDKMQSACEASQKVFASLTVQQINFRPANGTHTPRWNAEHMMGRQLLFFTQIFAAIAGKPEGAFTAVDLNPKQMPPDYQPAHPNWTGAEEARQMERVNQFVRRFAYLLDGIDLDQPAPGSRWTLRRLLKQMDRHYGEHTANVKKKFELEGWPKPANQN